MIESKLENISDLKNKEQKKIEELFINELLFNVFFERFKMSSDFD